MKPNRLRGYLLNLLLTLPLCVAAQEWSGRLHDGSTIRVDPNTNQATGAGSAGERPLWDGVHRMEDGSVIIVKDGVVTSRPLSAPPTGSDPATDSATTASNGRPLSQCVQLMVKVCGFNGQCDGSDSCGLARQLVKLEQEELWQNRGENPSQTARQCTQSLQDEEHFQACNTLVDEKSTTPCQQLVTHVCGGDDRCAAAPACNPAKQLLSMEQSERADNRRPGRMTHSSHQCLDAVKNSNFFQQCPR